MVLLPTTEDFSQASGSISFSALNTVYEGLMDHALQGIGRTVTLHLQPIKEEDINSTDPVANSNAYNPFFHGSARPGTGSKMNRGYKVTPRDIQFTAHIRHGPKPEDPVTGAGRLEPDEVQTTTVIESLDYLKKCLSITIDGEVYERSGAPRVIGFSTAKYIIQLWKRKQEKEQGVA